MPLRRATISSSLNPSLASPINHSSTTPNTHPKDVRDDVGTESMRPTSPSSRSKSPPPIPNAKETRALDHDRQKLKKAAAFVRSRARKAAAAEAGHHVTALGHHAASPTLSSLSSRYHGTTASILKEALVDPLVRYEAKAGNHNFDAPDKRDVVLNTTPPVDAYKRPEVPLTELVIAKKTRKHDKTSPGYELIPALRRVIALDDSTDSVLLSGPELDFGEPWEHISFSSSLGDEVDEREKCGGVSLSYAKVASAANY